jgi:hypothetical protein
MDFSKFDSQIKIFFIQFFISGFKHLWFLQALIISMLLCSFLIKISENRKWLFVFALILLLFGLANSTYYNLFSSNNILTTINKSKIMQFIGTRNGLFYAPIYIIMGRQFALNKEHKYPLKNSLIGLVCSFILLAVESVYFVVLMKTSSTILWLSVVPLMYYIFRLVLAIDLNNNHVYVILRKVSIIIYLLHPVFIKVFEKIFTNNLILFIIVIISTFSVSIMIYYLSKKPGFLWLRWFY